MTGRPSLFAEKLRSYRASNGMHGRMTQEDLALLLDLSVDAISKYERSLSFVRGDLEHRLEEKLGWSRDEIVACREDWESRGVRQDTPVYQVLDLESLSRHFGGSWARAAEASLRFAEDEFVGLPSDFEPGGDAFHEFYATQVENWCGVLHKGEFVAKWALPFVFSEDETAFRDGRLVESDFTIQSFRRPLLPGTYFGYCPALIIRRGHEAASPLLLRSFVAFLENLIDREIFVHGIGTYSVSPMGLQVCRDLGMHCLGTHQIHEGFQTWMLPGHAVSRSIFGRRSPKVQRAYSDRFGADS